MILYFIIITFLVILLLLKKSNIIENLEPNMVTMSGTSNEISTILNQGDNESNQNITKTFSEGVYLTNNDINYELLDDKINSLKRQIQLIEYNIHNLKIDLQIVTDTNSSIDPIVKVYGSFPSNIIFHITLPSAVPGKIGTQGEKGNKGEKGQIGKQGKKGVQGPFGACPN
tara:strand:+ start:4390 stop:4902 length:513 start_codon:yes stop_codon:yes gene_type:complete